MKFLEIRIEGGDWKMAHGVHSRAGRVGSCIQREKEDWKDESMKCIHWEARMKKATAPFHIDRKGYHVSLDAVPAWVCGQCGEPSFEEREVRTIQCLLSQLDRQTASLDSVV